MSQHRVYLSGPMTGLPECNYPAFDAAAAQLRAAGFTVANPTENTAPPCGTWEGWMRLSVIQLAGCTHVARLPGWEKSKGARIEVDLALVLGMTVTCVDSLLASAPVVTGGCTA